MATTSIINVNVDTNTKEDASRILKNLGMNMSTAINVFLKQVIEHEGIPFEIRNSNRLEEKLRYAELHGPRRGSSLSKALKEARDIETGKSVPSTYSSAEEMIGDILHDQHP